MVITISWNLHHCILHRKGYWFNSILMKNSGWSLLSEQFTYYIDFLRILPLQVHVSSRMVLGTRMIASIKSAVWVYGILLTVLIKKLSIKPICYSFTITLLYLNSTIVSTRYTTQTREMQNTTGYWLTDWLHEVLFWVTWESPDATFQNWITTRQPRDVCFQ